MRTRILLAVFMCFMAFTCVKSQQDFKSPEKAGKLVINDLLSRPGFMMYNTEKVHAVHYAEACAGFGAIRLAALLKDQEMINKLSVRYSRVLDSNITNTANHVDVNVYGILPLELYLQTHDKKFLIQGLDLADGQWKDTLPDGLTVQTRYWIDDVWMIGSLQVQAYRATGNPVYLDRAAKEADSYIKKLQQPNGLFYHGEHAPFFWGRGNGWVAAGLAEILSELPENNPHYLSILTGYKKMMQFIFENQADDGMWCQLVDHPESFKETSSTAMFGYAMSLGVKKGLLPVIPYEMCTEKAWKALAGYIDDKGQVREVCIGTGQSQDVNFYLTRPRVTGDLHGQAPVLWFAYSLLL
jgi:rhamnogalacturonyl hydrolase YesR